jgi:23S rRNA (guanosine2251-2'-O)-methyltransferase
VRYISSFHGILESLRSGSAVKNLLLANEKEGRNPGPRIREILLLARQRGIGVVTAEKADLDRIDSGNRGILLELEAQETKTTTISLEDYLARGLKEDVVLVLDHIEDPQNLGAILRSADAFGVGLVILPIRRASPVSDATVRASAGAAAWAPLSYVQNLTDAVQALKKNGYWAYAADMDGDSLPNLDLPPKTCFILGNEGAGVSRLLSETADGKVSIPMLGHVDSLNVSVAAAICVYSYRLRHSGSIAE